MPFYDYRCEDCKTEFSKRLNIDSRHEPCNCECPSCKKLGHVRMVVGTPSTVSGVSIKDKRPDGWKDVLGNIKKKAGRTNTIDL